MGKLCARVAALLSALFSVFFCWLWYQQYWQWDFNDLGRYYDPVDHVVYTDSGFVWIVPAVLALVATAVFAWLGWGKAVSRP